MDELIDGHERETHAVEQVPGKLLAIGAVKAHPPDNSLHTTLATVTDS